MSEILIFDIIYAPSNSVSFEHATLKEHIIVLSIEALIIFSNETLTQFLFKLLLLLQDGRKGEL